MVLGILDSSVSVFIASNICLCQLKGLKKCPLGYRSSKNGQWARCLEGETSTTALRSPCWKTSPSWRSLSSLLTLLSPSAISHHAQGSWSLPGAYCIHPPISVRKMSRLFSKLLVTLKGCLLGTCYSPKVYMDYHSKRDDIIILSTDSL